MLPQKFFHSRIRIVEIRNYRHAGGARPARCLACGGGVVPIDVQGARANDPLVLQFFRLQRQARVAFPQDRALSGVVDENKCLLAGATCSGEEMRLDANLGKFRAVHFCRGIFADFAYITRSQSPLLARDHCGRHLAARQHIRGAKLHFRTQRRVVRQRNHGVGGVQSHADDINLG